jgi:hypothetical protein
VDDHLRSHGTRRSPFTEIFIDEAWPPELAAAIRRIHETEERIMSVQDDINTALAKFQALYDQATATAADLATVAAELAEEIASLNGQGADTSGLVALAGKVDTVTASLVTAQGGIDALVPAPAQVDPAPITDPASPADSAAPAPVIPTPAPADTTPVTAPSAS